jgi:PAS domain S-box-containing protein
VFFASAFAFFMGAMMIRRMRRSFTDDAETLTHSSSVERLPLHTYHAVIQQLKQQKHELISEQQAARRRAKNSDSISAAVLSNLSCGVIFFTPNGLVRQANAAAKRILGFASPSGMSLEEVFRTATATSTRERVAENIGSTLHGDLPYQRIEAQYATPAGEERTLDITVTTVNATSGEMLGGACLINDQTTMTQIQQQQQLRGEMSSEMALALRSSLTTISGYAQQLAASRDPELTRQLAADISAEAAQLDQTIGGFLAGARVASDFEQSIGK